MIAGEDDDANSDEDDDGMTPTTISTETQMILGMTGKMVVTDHGTPLGDQYYYYCVAYAEEQQESAPAMAIPAAGFAPQQQGPDPSQQDMDPSQMLGSAVGTESLGLTGSSSTSPIRMVAQTIEQQTQLRHRQIIFAAVLELSRRSRFSPAGEQTHPSTSHPPQGHLLTSSRGP